mgnify:FL=1
MLPFAPLIPIDSCIFLERLRSRLDILLITFPVSMANLFLSLNLLLFLISLVPKYFSQILFHCQLSILSTLFLHA